ncbi:MAG: acyl-CoA/acyl-ACP dehydrogenase [Moorea sp. SIO1F2]|uniref:Acyl-CoA dehydrogenase n=1 Tax=Moorena bouillonii PNG TaxID=568701 RepID=A0A1U7N0B3_9CYAN|nr:MULTISPECIES: acyl-CoA dehydrogenase family protein [Moorena]NEN96139.1 acyl-CoA/acyl-ACP dehydrogenase [Moorena sp. SIO3I7]NEO62461.1 acyl-CoA/acyl-ACP dehydrogenase [Moorena sp. SIO4G2]NEQ79644.1 acyl-CoA/acyl-ACP dehydrogenase [Moorena sp. SIO2I5]NEO07657.1 acyl-CoA/acyl-ACP dehydrogenase [Moorena sp. SIO3I8]NEO15657.1 acyl-CoA/acyl-ACP dehydrogenase [Moorena sp. SIO3E8]
MSRTHHRVTENTESNRDEQQALLEIAESYLREFVAPVASEIDDNPEVLRAALQGMGARSLLALQIPKVWGGTGVSELTFRHFQQLIPRYSGALAFLHTQHQSAGEFLTNTDNESLKWQYLPYMSQGQVLLGIGFSHLRRQGKSMVKAIPVAGGYQIEGKVPWVTGFGFFQDFILGATLPDGRAVYGMLPFIETMQETGGAITFSKPMELGAMSSTNTVTAELTHWFLPEERVVFIKPTGAIHENDRKNVLNHGFDCLGNTRAGLDIIEAVYQTKQLPFIKQAFDAFNEELKRCQSAMMAALTPDSQSCEERLQLRAWAINLAQRCTAAAVTVSSGAANYRHHGAQRVYREALVFTVLGQTRAVMEATLAQLVN